MAHFVSSTALILNNSIKSLFFLKKSQAGAVVGGLGEKGKKKKISGISVRKIDSPKFLAVFIRSRNI